MFNAGKPHDEKLIEWLKKSDDNQREFLKANLEENSDMPLAILDAIRQIAEARGYEALAKEAGFSPKSLYRILRDDKDPKPRYETISQLVHALGLRITVERVS
jgi:probable addiction module antidote protein